MTTYHFHHIIPRHMGGTDDPSNLIKLTVKDHAEAHRLLWEEHGNIKDYLAWQGLSGMIGKEEIIKQLMLNANIGRKDSPETRLKKSKSRTGSKNPMFGRKRPDLSNYNKTAKKDKPSWNKGLKMNFKERECPHCGLIGKGPNMSRYHFDNCKSIQSSGSS